MAVENRAVLEEMQKETSIVDGRGRKLYLSDVEAEVILKDPRPAQEIADDYGVCRTTIYRIKRGLTKHHAIVNALEERHYPVGGRPVLSEEDAFAILNDPRKYKEIAEEYGVSISTVCRVKSRIHCAIVRDPDDPHAPDPIVAVVDGKPIFASHIPKRRRPRPQAPVSRAQEACSRA